MGITILAGGGYGLDAECPILQGDCHADWETATLTDDVPVLAGDAYIGNGAYIEGSFPIFDDPITDDSLVGNSNAAFLEDEMPIITGELIPGGELTVSLPLAEADFTGEVPSYGTIEDDVPVYSGSFTAGAELVSDTLVVSGSFSAVVPSIGTLNSLSSLPIVQGSCDSSVPSYGTLESALPIVTSSITGYQNPTGTLTGSMPSINGTLDAQAACNGTLTGDMPTIASYLSGYEIPTGDLEGDLYILSGTLQDDGEYTYPILRHVRGQIR